MFTTGLSYATYNGVRRKKHETKPKSIVKENEKNRSNTIFETQICIARSSKKCFKKYKKSRHMDVQVKILIKCPNYQYKLHKPSFNIIRQSISPCSPRIIISFLKQTRRADNIFFSPQSRSFLSS